jgi:two-component system response regulator YesN
MEAVSIMSQFKLMIIDDEILIRNGLAKIISSIAPQWMVVGDAVNGDEAIAIIEAKQPQLIITDINMPCLDGISMFTIIKEKYPHIKCIALSGYTNFEYVRQMLKLGSIDYLIKPVQKNLLLETLKKVEQEILAESQLVISQNEEKQRLCEFWLYQLISGTQYELQVCENHLTKLGIVTDSPFINLLIISMDWKEDELNYRSTYLYFLYKLAKELLASDGFVFRGNEGEIFVLFWEPHIQKLKDATSLFANIFLDFIKNSTKLSITIGISATIHHFYHLTKAYDQALAAVKYNMLLGNNIIIDWPEVNTAESSDPKQPYQINRILSLALQHEDRERIHQILHDAFQPADKETFYSMEYVQHLYLLIIFCLEEFAIRHGTNLECISSTSFVSITEGYKNVNKLEHLTSLLFELIVKLLSFIQENRTNENFNVILKANKYISEHLKINLTLQSVAEHVNLNPTYLSEIYKKKTGQNFVDYVIQCRVELAKKLIQENKLKWSEITEEVGYLSPNHFTKVFKEHVGMLPSEFKKLC